MPPEETYLRAPDGLDRFVRTWRPAASARAAVVIVHGICEHGGRYAELAECFYRAGFRVCVPDLLGHGHSAGPRVHVRRFEQFVADVERAVQLIRADEPRLPIFVLGHSMGGAIAARLAVRSPQPLSGVILSAPAVRVHDFLFPWLRKLAVVGSVLFPRVRLVRMGSRYLSRDPAVVADFERDPLVFHERFTVRIGAEVLRAARQVETEAARLTVPLLIMHGDQDVVVDLEGSRALYAGSGAADKTLRIYPGAYHDLFHDPGWPDRAAEASVWMTAHGYFPAAITSNSATEP